VNDEQHKERRRAPRHSTNIEVDYAAESTFLFAYITDISSMGIFIKTEEPAEVGAELKLKFSPPEDVREHMEGADASPLELVGKVVWRTDPETTTTGNPGMGIKFTEVEAYQRSRLMDLVRAIAYLDDSQNN
jgi:type IV pilus assembly protein PilZ